MTRLRILAECAVAGLLSAAALAQVRSPQTSPAALREDLQRARALHERLVDTRIAYDLGLPVQADSYFALTEAERARSREAAEKLLLEEQARVTALGVRLTAVEDKAAKSARRVAQMVTDGASGQPDGERDGAAPPLAPATAAPLPTEPFAIADADLPARPAEEPAARGTPEANARAPVLLRGSQDHSRVGRALFFAKRYDRAREELDAAVKQGGNLVDLFYLARSCEALADTTAADELYLQVEVKDTPEVDGKKVPGPWARAARVARRQMQWIRDNGQWQPARAIEAVPWRNR